MKNIYIKVDRVCKSFKNEVVLKNVSLNCVGGKVYGIVGRNGSGKSVLFKIICGFLYQDSGNVIVNDKIIGKDVDFPENLGAIIEAPGFLWFKSGISNLMYLAGIRNLITKDQVKNAMKLVGLDPNNKKLVGKYSLGMKQRLNIAQAIMENPDFLILDEPMNGLDEDGIKDIRELIIDLKKQGKLILLASHNKDDIEYLCDEVYTIKNGYIQSMTGSTCDKEQYLKVPDCFNAVVERSVETQIDL